MAKRVAKKSKKKVAKKATRKVAKKPATRTAKQAPARAAAPTRIAAAPTPFLLATDCTPSKPSRPDSSLCPSASPVAWSIRSIARAASLVATMTPSSWSTTSEPVAWN